LDICLVFGTRLRATIRLDRFILALSGGERPLFLPFYGLRHLVMSTVGGSLRKLSTCAQLGTFPYPTASKSFLCSKVFLAKSCAQHLTFTHVTDKQANKQTKKLHVFGRPGGGQGCCLRLDVLVWRRSRDVSMSRLGLVSTKIVNLSVSCRSRSLTSRARDQFSTKFCRLQ